MIYKYKTPIYGSKITYRPQLIHTSISIFDTEQDEESNDNCSETEEVIIVYYDGGGVEGYENEKS